jgi:hypothetical protein
MVGKRKGTRYSDVLDAPRQGARKDACSLEITIQLQRVDPSQTKGLTLGRPLEVSLKREKNVKSVICVRPDNNKFLGSIAFSGVDKLIACLEKGRQYEAIVEAISGAAIHVKIIDV